MPRAPPHPPSPIPNSKSTDMKNQTKTERLERTIPNNGMEWNIIYAGTLEGVLVVERGGERRGWDGVKDEVE